VIPPERSCSPQEVVSRSGDADVAARVDRLERLLELLADAAGFDLDRLDTLDRVERRGYPIEWHEFDALGINPQRHP